MNPVVDSYLSRLENAILNPLITLLALAAFLLFVWGVVEFIRSTSQGGEGKETGKQHMIWGIVGLVIIFGARAIIAIIGDTVLSIF